MLVDFKIKSIFHNFSQNCSNIGTCSDLGTLTLHLYLEVYKNLNSETFYINVYFIHYIILRNINLNIFYKKYFV